MTRLALILTPLLLLAACGTPLEQCLSSASSPYRSAMKERERIAKDLARGYTFKTEFERVYRSRPCRVADGHVILCRDSSMEPVTKRVPIDEEALRARDAELLRQLPALRAQASSDMEICRQSFPEAETPPS